jgi:hypothetical protein
MSLEQCRIFHEDVRVRANANFELAPLQAAVYQRIRSLYTDLGCDAEGSGFGDWKDVPILQASMQGFKRKHWQVV